MQADAQAVTEAVAGLWRTVGRDAEGATLREADGLLAATSGVALATMNGVWSLAAQVDEVAAAAMAAHVAEAGLPWCIQARPGSADVWSAIAATAGLVAGPTIPLMAADAASLVEQQPRVPLEIVRLDDRDLGLHVEVGAAGFEMPADLYRDSMRAISCVPGQRTYVGFADGVPVTTLITFPTAGDSVGVFNVATPAEHRGRGFGGAATAAAVREALDGGARWAWLQSSPEGYRVYQRIGFATLEQWDFWLKP